MLFEGTFIEIKPLRETNCTHISYAHVIIKVIAGCHPPAYESLIWEIYMRYDK